MDHAEFVTGFRRGALRVDVDRSKALEIGNATTILPKRYQSKHLLWTAMWLLTLPAAGAAAFLYTWWAGAVILFLVTPAVFSTAKRLAAQSVLDYALESGEFYAYAVENSVMTVQPKN